MRPSKQDVKIGDRVVADFQNGIYKHSDEYTDEGTRIVRINDYGNDGTKRFECLRRVRLSASEINRFSLKRNDILINRVNSLSHVGKSCIVEGFEETTVFESNMMRLRLSESSRISPEYLFLVLNTARTRDYLRKVAKPAVAQASINQDDIRSLSAYFPGLQQQTAIASLLSNWDAAIDKTERLIAAKGRQKRTLMQSLLTGKRRLKGFQKPWVELYMGDLFKERCERGDSHLPLLSITREEGVISRDGVARKDTSSEDKSKYLRISPGDIGYNTMRMWQGVSALSSLEGIVSPAYTICTPTKRVDGNYMAYLFKSPRMINLFYRYSQGLTSDTWNLKFHHFKEIKVKIPAIDEQKAIAKVLKVCDEEIHLFKRQAEAYRRQKRGLMQKLLTGEWRVELSKEVVNG